jgi:ABC-type multidrug transport system ATPase subunit/DNA-binding beta-propeller fold protein YncE
MSKNIWDLRQVMLAGRLRPRLDRVTLTIPPGVTAIVGPSGAGKTSLLNILVAFESALSGTVRFHPPSTERLPLFWVPQNDSLWPHLPVGQHLAVVSPLENGSIDAVRPILEGFDLLDNHESFPNSLSQGERSRLALARAVAANAAVMVMDEPMATVDEIRARRYWRVLRHLCGDATALVFASHGVESVIREADYVICMADGKVRYQGSVKDLYYRPATRALAEFLGPVNWFAPAEASQWLQGAVADTVCCRPEQVLPEPANDGPLRVIRHSAGAALSELTVVNSATKSERTILHRMGHQCFRNGGRVLFRLLPLLMLSLLVLGCGDSSRNDPLLAVRQVRHWPMPPAGGSIPAPRAVQIGHAGEVVVLDNAGRVLIFSAQAELLRQWEMPEHEVGKPEGLWVMKDGRIAVADTHYSRILFFDRQGLVLGTQGKYGRGPNEFIYPVAITQDDQQYYYVCEYGENDRVQKFSVGGDFVCSFGGFGTAAGEFQRPSGIVWHDGKVLVADAINNRIQVFSDDGVFLKVLKDSSASWQLEYPYDLAKGVEGDLYLIEYGGGRLSWLDRDGKLLGRWGQTGSAKGELATPWGLAVDGRRRVYIADTGNRRIVELQL